MTDFETGAVETTVETETPEVTEPEEGAVNETEVEPEVEETETPEVTEPEEPELPEGKKAAAAAFAEMRKENAEMKATIAEFQSWKAEQERAERNDKIETLAEELGIDPVELQQAIDEEEADENRLNQMLAENVELRAELEEREITDMMKEDLAEIQAIDPNIKSLDDLPGYTSYVAGGLRGAKAYLAIKAEQEFAKPKPAKAPGAVNKTPQERDYFTEEEIDQMSVEEIRANLPKVRRSVERF